MLSCVSYPKSGRTWLWVMLDELGVEATFTHLDTGADKGSFGRPMRRLGIPALAGRVLFLHRDPRDTAVSFFHEMTKRQRKKLPWGRRLRFALQGRLPPMDMPRFVRSPRFGIEKTVRFNLACHEHLDGLHIAYEALRADPVAGLTEIVKHAGHEPDHFAIRVVVEKNVFAKMREREASGHYDTNKLRPTDPNDPNSFKVRRGKIGGWQDEMDASTREYACEVLDRYDYFRMMA